MPKLLPGLGTVDLERLPLSDIDMGVLVVRLKVGVQFGGAGTLRNPWWVLNP